jgi:hypothetical protein
MAGLRGFIPNLLIMQYDLLWGGCEGVLAVMQNDPLMRDVSVVLFTENDKRRMLDSCRQIIARLTHPFPRHELTELNGLIVRIKHGRESFQQPRQGDSQSLNQRRFSTSTPDESDRGEIHHSGLNFRLIFSGNG